MNFFTKRDTTILMVIWNLTLTIATIIAIIIIFSLQNIANDNIDTLGNANTDFHTRVYELERRAGIDYLNPQDSTSTEDDTYEALKKRIEDLEAKTE
ncbi:hypothetical protein EOL71_03135 [Candidatus Saccharibacteria bacterium]|nr:hypothetical protein [Candidatus Saccharibacteria bacterium]